MTTVDDICDIDAVNENILGPLADDKRRKYGRFVLGVLGSVPWIGGFLNAMATVDAEKEQGKVNEFQAMWLSEHTNRLQDLSATMDDILRRFDQLGDIASERVQSDEYIGIARRAFRSWDSSETKEKRTYVRNLIINAAATELCVDDLIRLFNDWLDQYHEAHFKVIRAIYQKPGISRAEIWESVSSERPREDSAEADLFRLLIRDLSTGGVIRQSRETDNFGRFIKKQSRSKTSSSHVMESAFEETKPYVLTELGAQFVHYTMNEVTTRIE